MYLQSSIMSQISRKNSFGKVVFPFLVGNFMSRNRNCFFGRHFVILYPIFDFFPVFWFFWITLSVASISLPNSFGKVLFWVRVHRDPPLTTNGNAEGLDHLSVNCNFKISFTCQIAIIFGTLKNGSLLINTLASNICFSYRNIFQNGVDALSKIVDAFLSKSSKFYLVWIIR